MDTNYLFKMIMKYTNNSIIITDSSGNIEIHNSATEKMWRYSYDELKGLHINNLFNFGKKQSEEKICKNLFSLKTWSGEISALDKNNDVFYLHSNITTILDEHSKVMNYLIISENIQEKKSILKDLELKKYELKENLKNLQATQFMMIEEDKLANLGQLSAGIAHEINNPLGFIISNFGTLKKYIERLNNIINLYKDLVNSSKQGHLQEEELINLRNAEKKYNLDFIIDDISDLLKDTEGGIERIQKIVLAMRNFAHSSRENEFDQYDLNEGIKNTLVIAKNEIKYNSSIETEFNKLPIVEAISNEINQVILNIIINSSHAIKEKQESMDSSYFGLLKITSFSDEYYVYCSIEDNGAGISEENLKKILKPFFTTKPVGKGTGLGLSIANDIIKNKHKGDLIVESILGIGTKITIKLPIKQQLQTEEGTNE